MNDRKYLTVSALNRYLAYKFEQDPHLNQIYLQGEISNFRSSKGHWYFVIKDDESEIAAVMFSSSTKRVAFTPRDGTTVFLVGSVSLYQKKGTYNITVQEMQESGVGLLHQAFIQLKDRLSKEGLFAEEKKKPIPIFNDHIALITSPTGDAYWDMHSTITKRYPLATIYLYPVLVQGPDAPLSIIRALQKANQDQLADVIIIARGGGSVEDLSCFNDEQLAREIASSVLPIVSGVGHESDFTICDFVSDFRAPTPTGAAVKVTQDQEQLKQNIDYSMVKLKTLFDKNMDFIDNQYKQLVSNYHFKNFVQILDRKIKDFQTINMQLINASPLKRVERNFELVDEYRNRIRLLNLPKKIQDHQKSLSDAMIKIKAHIDGKILNYENNIQSSIERLIISNPLTLMDKGYTLTYQEKHLIKTVSEINRNLPIQVRFSDGTIEANITKIHKED